MKIKQLKTYIDQGDEIEFLFNGKRFSITYGEINGKEVISFCEFNKKSTEVNTFEELLKVVRYGVNVKQMVEKCNENDVWIF